MAENEEPKIRRTVTLGSGNKIVYKTDGKSYFQRIVGGRIVSEREIFADQVEERIAQDPPRQATTSIERLSPDQLKTVIGNIESLRPNAQGRYVYQGKTITEGARDALLKEYKGRLKELEDISRRSGEEAARPDPAVEQEIKRVNQIRTSLSQKIQDFKDETRTVTTVGGQNNLNSWVNYYERQFERLTKYVDDLSNGRTRVGSVDTNFNNVSIEQATTRPTTGGAAPQAGTTYGGVPGAGQAMPAGTTTPFTPSEGQNVFGGTQIQPGTMLPGQEGTAVDLSGVNFPETPADTTTRPSGTTPGTVATPTPEPAGTTGGPTFTEPATGVTYRPGDRVGGEDRTLPNGGAVVDGIYIPPGVDYTWLANQVPEDWKTAAKELYGAYYDMIKNDPQISKLLEDAIKLGYSDAKFQAELEKTDWWRKTTANARQFQVLETTDPATARAQLDNRIALVRETAQRMGVTLAATSLESIARNAINLGFDLTAQVEDLVGSEAIRSAGGVSQLRFGYVGNSIRESARKFGVALSDTTFNEWVNKIAVGAESTETFESYAQQISRTLYPSLAAGYDRGLTFAQLTDPYAQQASRILEIPASQVDFTDPKWAQAFTMKDEKGNPTQMSYGEWADYLRTNPSFGWEYTDDAKNRAYTVVNRLAELFGAA